MQKTHFQIFFLRTMDQLRGFLRVSVSGIFNLKIPSANKGLRTLPVAQAGQVSKAVCQIGPTVLRLLQHLNSEGEQNYNAFAAPQIS